MESVDSYENNNNLDNSQIIIVNYEIVKALKKTINNKSTVINYLLYIGVVPITKSK